MTGEWQVIAAVLVMSKVSLDASRDCAQQQKQQVVTDKKYADNVIFRCLLPFF